MKKFPYLSRFILFSVVALTLTACGKPLESPDDVIIKAKQAVVDIRSGKVEVSAEATGKNGDDNLSFDGGVILTIDKQEAGNPKLDLGVDLSGKMKAGEQVLNGDVDLNFITIGKQYYVKLNKLESNDQSLASVKPFIDLYSGKWLRLAEDFIPKNLRDLQNEDDASKLKKEQLEELFVETKLFDVVKEYDVEKLDGKNVYHYGLEVNKEGFKEYMSKAAIIDGRQMSPEQLEESLKVLSYIKSIDTYIDTEDYYFVKSVLLFSGAALNQDAGLEMKITVKGSQFDESMKIEAPEGAEDFNPLNLMMGLGASAQPQGSSLPSSEEPASEGSTPVEGE